MIKNFNNFKIDSMLDAVDWKGIPEDYIDQIKHESRSWYYDYTQIQEYKKILGEEVGEPAEDKFNRWIVDRIQMVFNRDIDE